MNLKINYIELPAADLDAIEAFYAGAFGWTFQDYGPEYRAFNDGALDGGFFRSDLKSNTDHGATMAVLFADDLEAAQARVLEHGGIVKKEIFSFPGGRRFQFEDPHGNELAIWSDK